MWKHIATISLATLVALFVVTGAEAAMNARVNAGTNIGAGPVASSTHASMSTRTAFTPGGFSEGRKVSFNGRHVPPGWSRGRKVGWHHASTPPGLRR